MKRAVVVLPLLAAVACATVPAIKTPSGKPEVIVSNATPVQIIDHLANDAVDKGWTIRDRNERKLVVAREKEGVLSRMVVGSSDALTVPEERVTFDIVASSASWRMLGARQLVGSPGTPRERRIDTTSSAVSLQGDLDRMRAALSSAK